MTTLEPKVGPYLGVVRDQIIDHGRNGKFRILLYCAYSASGLIGTECNGIVVLNDTAKDVVCDEFYCEPFRAPTAKQQEVFKNLTKMDWDIFRDTVNTSTRLRYQLRDQVKVKRHPGVANALTSVLHDSEFMPAQKKRTVLKQWATFLEHGCQLSHFTKALYDHLTLHCSFIAHYNLGGFYGTYFTDPTETLRFLGQFDAERGCISIECGSNTWLRGDFADINNGMVAIAGYCKPVWLKRLRAQQIEKATAAVAQTQKNLQRLQSEAL